ncbi:MAG TPA: DMT family transporter [Bacillota bacterium]|nr:DMT family transporter [Bacillota bacterium]
MGVIYALIAGIFISMQGIFNARVGEKLGCWQTNAIVHGSGFILVLLVLTCKRCWDFNQIGAVNKWYLIGGILGVFVVLCIMKSITALGVSYTAMVVIITQLMATTVFKYFGLFQEPAAVPGVLQIIGIALMIGGVVLYQVK